MSTAAVITCCEGCGAEIGHGMLACPACARLVHGQNLRELAGSAEAAERNGDPSEALRLWRLALELLPASTVQRATIEGRMKRLSAEVDGRAPTASHSNRSRTGILAGAATLGVVLFKFKALITLLLGHGKLLLIGLTKLPTLLSMLLYAQWSSGHGIGFGIGLVASIYVHEVGHVAALRRYGIEASAPMFVPGFGAFVRMKQYPTDAYEEARTGLAGPLWGLAAAMVAAVIGKLATQPVAIAVASVGGTLNLFNLIPVWQLDGARGLRALNRSQRLIIAVGAVVVGIGLKQWMPAIIGVCAAVRAFEREIPQNADRRILALYTGLVIVLALIATLPGISSLNL